MAIEVKDWGVGGRDEAAFGTGSTPHIDCFCEIPARKVASCRIHGSGRIRHFDSNDHAIASGWSATRKLSCNRVREVIEANRRGTWTINAVTGDVES
jgi:hypothetical protein